MNRSLAVALALGSLLVTSSRTAACPDPLKPYCVYLPSATLQRAGSCERVTGDAFEDITAWRLDRPAAGKGRVELVPEAAFTGQAGVLIDARGDQPTSLTGAVGLSSTGAATRRPGIWLTMRVRRAPGSPDSDSITDALGAYLFRQGGVMKNNAPGNLVVHARDATEDWIEVRANMDSSATAAGADRLSIRVWAQGTLHWHVDDVELWQCPAGREP